MAALTIQIDGSALDSGLAARLVAAEVRQLLDSPALAQLTFVDSTAELEGALAMGAAVAIDAGQEQLFTGEVTAIRRERGNNRQRSLTVRAYDRLHRLRKRQTVERFEQAALPDLVEALASTGGFSVSMTADPPRRALVINHAASDFDLLRRSAQGAGLHFAARGDELSIFTLGGDGSDPICLDAEQLLEVTSDISAEAMRKSVRCTGWDLASNRVLTGAAGAAAQDQLEMRMDALAAFEGLGERSLLNTLADTEAEATAFAQADMDGATARGLHLDALADGDPRLRPGQAVELAGLGAEADGPFVVTSAIHRFDIASGYTTRIGTAPPASALTPGSAAATLGMVQSNDDPSRQLRVQVTLPLFGGLQSDWMPVLALGAGQDRGLLVLPEPGDEVLVLLPDGDPARGIVLGGLYGQNAPPDHRVAGQPCNMVVRTSSGSQFIAGSGDQRIRIESGQGDLIEFADSRVTLRAARDLVIEAPGRNLKIRAAQVDFERA